MHVSIYPRKSNSMYCGKCKKHYLLFVLATHLSGEGLSVQQVFRALAIFAAKM